MMDDHISRQAAIDAIDGTDWYHLSDSGEMVQGANDADHQAWYRADDIYRALWEMPDADVVSAGAYKQAAWERDIAVAQLKELGYSLGEKIRHGHWIELDGNDANYFCCDRCGRRSDFKEPFCPNCGARMDEGSE